MAFLEEVCDADAENAGEKEQISDAGAFCPCVLESLD
jgi:hypothetical protein